MNALASAHDAAVQMIDTSMVLSLGLSPAPERLLDVGELERRHNDPQHVAKEFLSVVVRNLRSHPEKLNDDFVWLIMNALGGAWPCR